MSRRLSFLKPSPTLVVALAALLAACSGLAVAATSSRTSVIRACANKKTGALRLASKCRRSERSLSWNKEGIPGRRGVAGATGATGAFGAQGNRGPRGEEGPQGEEGAQGPGATSFSTTLLQGTVNATLTTLSNGLKILATCTNGPANVGLTIATVGLTNTLQASGTANNGAGTFEADTNLEPSMGTNDPKRLDLDVIARDSNVGRFVRIDVHGEFGVPCTYWGMITPSN